MITEPANPLPAPLSCSPAHASASAPAIDPHAPASLAPSAPSPHSPVSSQDRALLSAYLQAREDLHTLATSTGQDYFDLLHWCNQPHIQTALAAHDQATARADRRAALEALRESLETAETHADLRRAATTLLRSTIVRTMQPARDRLEPPSPRDKRGEVVAAATGEGGLSSSPSVASSLRPSVALPPLPPLPPPTSRPTPNADPKPTFANIKAALIAPQLPLALSTLHAHATPTATFAGHPIPADPATWPDSLPATLPKGFTLPLDIIEAKEVERTETPAGARSRWTLQARTSTSIHIFDCALTLTKSDRAAKDPTGAARDNSPDPPCWRLAAFDILRRSG